MGVRRAFAPLLVLLFAAMPLVAAGEGKVTGSFIVGGADAQLQHVRAKPAKLDEKGLQGYAVLLSAKPATGDILAWQTADPSERGSFIFLLLEKNGNIWVAELGHVKAKSGRFGVVTELQKASFEVQNGRIVAHLRTDGEQVFTDDHYKVDLTFDVPLESP